MYTVLSLAVLATVSAPGQASPGQAAPGGTGLVQFSSQRCQHCSAMQPIVAQLVLQGVQVHVVDVDQQPEVARQYKVQGVPTFVAVAEGREVGRIEGVTTGEKLGALVRSSEVGGQRSEDGAGAGVSAEQIAKAATVRIKVEDGTGYGFGTGTLIDTHDSEALVVTCGHLFRESKGQGKISADVFSNGAPQTVDGHLIAYDLDRDIALISLRMPASARPALIAPPGYSVRPGDRAFTVGCDKGAEPSLRATHVTAVNKYKGKPNFTAAGQPVDGRSGGGLFSAEGYLIGICNAADPADDEGLYAGLASIHWQLDQIGQASVYQRAAQVGLAKSNGNSADNAIAAATFTQPVAETVPAAVPLLPPSMPPLGAAPVVAGDDSEIVFIVRSKSNPGRQSEVFVVDQAPPDLIARITRAAQDSGERRAALARLGQAPHVAAAQAAR